MAAKQPKPFTVDQICHIISVCSKKRVSGFKFGDLSLTFGAETAPSFIKEKNNLPTKRQMRENEKLTTSGYTETEEEELRREQIMIDDPVAYENEQIDRLTNRDVDARQRFGEEAEENTRPQ